MHLITCASIFYATEARLIVQAGEFLRAYCDVVAINISPFGEIDNSNEGLEFICLNNFVGGEIFVTD